MTSKVCLRCGRENASYASQCIHCQRGFNERYLDHAEAHKQVILILTAYRQGKSPDAIATSLNEAGILRLGELLPWDKQNVAYIVHSFVEEGINKECDIERCESCNAPLVESGCRWCRGIRKEQAPAPARRDTTVTGAQILIFNALVIGVWLLYVFICRNYVTDGEGFNSSFGALFLIIGGTMVAAAFWVFGNIALIAAAMLSSQRKC